MRKLFASSIGASVASIFFAGIACAEPQDLPRDLRMKNTTMAMAKTVAGSFGMKANPICLTEEQAVENPFVMQQQSSLQIRFEKDCNAAVGIRVYFNAEGDFQAAALEQQQSAQ